MVLIITATVVVTLFAAHRPFRLATRASSSSISACAIRRPKLFVIIAFFQKRKCYCYGIQCEFARTHRMRKWNHTVAPTHSRRHAKSRLLIAFYFGIDCESGEARKRPRQRQRQRSRMTGYAGGLHLHDVHCRSALCQPYVSGSPSRAQPLCAASLLVVLFHPQPHTALFLFLRGAGYSHSTTLVIEAYFLAKNALYCIVIH